MSNDASSTAAPRRGRLIVVSGPTASGKSTLWRRLVQLPGVDFSVSATTRPPRPGEVDGRDYHFMDDAEFQRHVDAGDFLEWAEVHGHRYGTLKSEVEKGRAKGHDVVLEIDVQGAKQLRDLGLPMVSVFVEAPSEEELRRRLLARGTESPEEVERRLARVRSEMAEAGHYDFVVVNDDVDEMVRKVEEFLGYEPGRGVPSHDSGEVGA